MCYVLTRGSRWSSGEILDVGVSPSGGLKPDSMVPRCVTLGKLLLLPEALVLICKLGIRITFQLGELN